MIRMCIDHNNGGAGDGYGSVDFVAGSGSSRETKKGVFQVMYPDPYYCGTLANYDQNIRQLHLQGGVAPTWVIRACPNADRLVHIVQDSLTSGVLMFEAITKYVIKEDSCCTPRQECEFQVLAPFLFFFFLRVGRILVQEQGWKSLLKSKLFRPSSSSLVTPKSANLKGLFESAGCGPHILLKSLLPELYCFLDLLRVFSVEDFQLSILYFLELLTTFSTFKDLRIYTCL
ncbi:hypothetical protein Tco_1515197 [Tanacetum coccineum]